jgi:hypothetical protein
MEYQRRKRGRAKQGAQLSHERRTEREQSGRRVLRRRESRFCMETERSKASAAFVWMGGREEEEDELTT